MQTFLRTVTAIFSIRKLRTEQLLHCSCYQELSSVKGINYLTGWRKKQQQTLHNLVLVNVCQCSDIDINAIIIIIYPLTARVVGAPQMKSQPAFSIFPVIHCPLGPAELQACPFPDVVFPPLPLSALSSTPFHCALQDGFGQTRWTGNMTIPLQFVSFYDGQEVFVRSNCLLNLGTDFLIGNIVFVWDM